MLDDGWFGSRRDDRSGLGDWTVSPEVWPNGLHPLVDKVTELGMQFGLWFEPEMINTDSDAARAHPEWVMATGDRLPVESRFQQVINLGLPDCYAFIRDAIFAILREYAIGYIKWDHNRDLIDAGTQAAGRPGVHEQTLAFYRLLDEIKTAFPGLEIESCSSGGARVDLGVLERTERVWVSDCIDPLERQEMHRWTTQLIPPELMGAHIASGQNHTTGRIHDLDFRAATAIFGHLGIEWDLSKASETELADLGVWIDFYKQHRDLLLGGDLVRIDFPDDSLNAHGVVAPDKSTRDLLAGLGGAVAAGLGGSGAAPRPRSRPALPGRPGGGPAAQVRSGAALVGTPDALLGRGARAAAGDPTHPEARGRARGPAQRGGSRPGRSDAGVDQPRSCGALPRDGRRLRRAGGDHRGWVDRERWSRDPRRPRPCPVLTNARPARCC